ncbi:MAG: N-acetylmuramidase family protein [Phenylobacterium sp.]|nr:N-acetylmuramidase family protein [Phenylobacterium sp.]
MTTLERFSSPAPVATLASGDFAAAAAVLGVNVAKVLAVDEVESRGRGFHPQTRRPIILFEPHRFSKLTKGAFDAVAPDVSYPKWGEAPYPAGQDARYAQLLKAARLDEGAALASASWGRFQIMGFNHRPAGFASVQAFVAAMVRSEAEHLLAFARFLKADPAMLFCLQKNDWAGFARRYNGEGYAQHGYDQRLKVAYARRLAAARA